MVFLPNKINPQNLNIPCILGNVDLYSYFYELVKQIPKGRVSTYGALARALGDIRAARACGVMLSQNPDAPRIPCHRVVMSDGSLGGFTHPEGVKKKIERLRQEGVEIHNGKIVNFQKILFEDFRTDYPLRRLREEQERMREKIVLEDLEIPDLVAGVDVSYKGRNAYASLVIMTMDGRVREIITKKRSVDFPYIPTYLAFREAPIIAELLKEVKEPVLLMVDGNGILHPRRFGLASHVGVENSMPTIGVAKSLLTGEIRGNKVFLGNEQLGWFLISGRKRGIYVSPGHGISLNTSLELVKKFLHYRVPEPLRVSHLEANKLRLLDKF